MGPGISVHAEAEIQPNLLKADTEWILALDYKKNYQHDFLNFRHQLQGGLARRCNGFFGLEVELLDDGLSGK